MAHTLQHIPTRALYHMSDTIKEWFDGRHSGRSLEEVIFQQLSDHYGIALNEKDVTMFIEKLKIKLN